ncbi:ATP-binding protein [Rathayibacter sp. YIM 133350]|uniref:sensor histidine kinase n=1 Tax=Rathayibacter sp. YIM 133350 TaxID=3131992 RepID=UPI00307D6725
MSAEASAARPPAALTLPERRMPLSTRSIRLALSRAIAASGLLFGLQTLPVMIGQLPAFIDPWGLILAGAVFGGIVVVAVSSVVDRGIRTVFAGFAIVFLLVELAWPLVVSDPSALEGERPWVWFLLTVASANAAMGFRLPIASAYVVVAPVLYAVVRALPAGGQADLGRLSLDTVYAVILGAAVLIIVVSLQQAAAAVDAAQGAALAQYEAAVRQNAIDIERVRVDALVHDSVLTTLLAAANAETPEQRRLATAMAASALARLDPEPEAAVTDVLPVSELARRLRATGASIAEQVTLRVHDIDDRVLPAEVLEVLFSAAVQAVVNSLQHAGSQGRRVNRSVTLSGTDRGCRIVVRDDGVGFDPGSVPAGRLGLRVSVRERMASVGGRARVASAPGEGTTVELEWPAEAQS